MDKNKKISNIELQYYDAQKNGMVFSPDNKVLIKCINCQITEAIIPDGVIEISSSAFSNCASLRDVKIPDSVATIGDWAFKDCVNLKSIVIPDSVSSMGGGNFLVL